MDFGKIPPRRRTCFQRVFHIAKCAETGFRRRFADGFPHFPPSFSPMVLAPCKILPPQDMGPGHPAAPKSRGEVHFHAVLKQYKGPHRQTNGEKAGKTQDIGGASGGLFTLSTEFSTGFAEKTGQKRALLPGFHRLHGLFPNFSASLWIFVFPQDIGWNRVTHSFIKARFENLFSARAPGLSSQKIERKDTTPFRSIFIAAPAPPSRRSRNNFAGITRIDATIRCCADSRRAF